MVERDNIKLPNDILVFQDSGYVGYIPDNVLVIMNKKSSKKHQLTMEERENNVLISKERITIEHIISGIKRLRIVSETCRLLRENIHHKMMFLACCLHNLRTTFRTKIYST